MPTLFKSEPLNFPTIIKTKNGVCIEPWKDIWHYRDTLKDVHLRFKHLPVEASLRNSIKYTFIWYAENRSQFYLINLFEGLLGFFKRNTRYKVNISEITPELIINYKATLPSNREYLLGGIAGFFRRMHHHHIGGISEEAMRLLNEMSLKGNVTGTSVLTMDPEKGPFSELEFQSLYSGLYDAYASEFITLADFLLIWLFAAMGHRPIQYAGLKVLDFQVSSNSKNEEVFSLSVPRAKQRSQKTRSEFKNRLLIRDIGLKFLEHTTRLKKQAHALGVDSADFPLFPASKADQSAPSGFEWHQTSQALALRAKFITSSLSIHSERTGALLRVPPQRFRYTVGTRAAIEGHGALVIAELLDHSDVQNVGVYIKAVPDLIEKFTPKLALQLAPLANAFKGKIICNESEGKTPDDPSLRIFALQHTGGFMKPTGSCGKHHLCELLEPLACYTCRSFQPWLDGPHETILERLIEDRERVFASTDGDNRIASINDLTMLAVADVVRQCRHMQKLKGP